MICAAGAVVLAAYGLFEPWRMWALSTIWLAGMAVAQKEPLKGTTS